MFKSFFGAICAIVMPLSVSAAVLEYTYAADFSDKILYNDAGFDEAADYDANRLEAMGPITGTLTFDDTLAIDAGNALHFGPVAITIDSFAAQGVETTILGTQMAQGSSNDSILSTNEGFGPGLPAGERTLLTLYLVDDTQTLFAGGLAFPDLIELSDFTRSQVWLRSTLYDPNLGPLDQPAKIVRFDLTNLTPVQNPSAVPLPAGLPLLLGGLATLGWAARRKTKRG